MECRETKDKEAKTKGRENKGGRKGGREEIES